MVYQRPSQGILRPRLPGGCNSAINSDSRNRHADPGSDSHWHNNDNFHFVTGLSTFNLISQSGNYSNWPQWNGVQGFRSKASRRLFGKDGARRGFDENGKGAQVRRAIPTGHWRGFHAIWTSKPSHNSGKGATGCNIQNGRQVSPCYDLFIQKYRTLAQGNLNTLP